MKTILFAVLLAACSSSPNGSRDLAKRVCENIVDRCSHLADPAYADVDPDIGQCTRKIGADLDDGDLPRGLATCMANAESCEAVTGCAFTEVIRRR